MQTTLTPEISTLNLSSGSRAIGRMVNMEIPDDSSRADQDLAGDTFQDLYQQQSAAATVAPERSVNKSLLDWARSTPAYEKLLNETRNSIPSSVLAGQMLNLSMKTDEVMKQALEKQAEADAANKAAEEAERQALAEQAMQTPTAEQAQAIADQLRQQADQQMAQAGEFADKIQANPLNKGALAAAIKDATGEAKRVNVILGGWGHGPGSQVAKDPKAALAFMKKMTPKLERISKFAGRMRGVGSNARRDEVQTGRSPAGIEFTKDFSRVMPSELAMISNAAPVALRASKLVQYDDIGLLGRQLRDIKDEAGPFVFGVDVSGSMEIGVGDGLTREESAKGVGLGLAQIAQAEGRTYELFSFSSGRDNLIRCSSTDSWEKHLTWAENTISGGTSFDIAIMEIIRVLTLMGDKGHNADAMLSSDGEAAVSTEVAAAWKAFAAKTGARLLYVPVATGYGSLEKLADRVITVNDAMDDEVMKQAATWMR